MDETKLFQSAANLLSDILSRHGIEGLIGLWIAYEKWIVPWKKKGKEDWVSWRDIKAMKEKQEFMQAQLNGHLSKCESIQGENLKEAVKINSMEKDIEYHGKEIEETKVNVQDIFKLLSEIKTMMIERKN